MLADVATVAEGVAAVEQGADAVASTMSGYTAYSPARETPDLALVQQLCRECPVPVIAEGHFEDPQDVRKALDSGAHAVVIGAALTRPQVLTERMVRRALG